MASISVLFACANGAASLPAWGNAPGLRTQASAESAIHLKSFSCRPRTSPIAPTPFRKEYREFLRKHGIDYDERYVWD
jgi:hypothetical protein